MSQTNTMFDGMPAEDEIKNSKPDDDENDANGTVSKLTK